MSVDLKIMYMKKFNLIVAVLAIIGSLFNVYIADDLFARLGWSCSAMWTIIAIMLQYEVNRLKREEDEEE